jgi:hypothetical protein
MNTKFQRAHLSNEPAIQFTQLSFVSNPRITYCVITRYIAYVILRNQSGILLMDSRIVLLAPFKFFQ